MRTLLGAILLSVALAACGSSSHSTSTTTASSSAVTASSTATPAAKTVAVRLAGIASGRKGTLASIEHLRMRRSRISAHISGFAGTTETQKLVSYAQSVAGFWTEVLGESSPPTQLPPATLEVIGQTPATCGSQQIVTTSQPGYCPATQSVQLPLQYITTQIEPIGDAAVLLIVSDMYGYEVLNTLGDLSKLSSSQLELADACLSGQYFFYGVGGNSSIHIDPGDEQAVTTLLTKMAPAGGSTSPGAVSAQQLIAAFNQGAVPKNGSCLSFS